MKKLVASCLFMLSCMTNAYAQTPPIVERYFGDDSYVHVPLQFGFPFYGRTFTNSWMHSNGVISFLDPAVSGSAGAWAYCCEGVPPSTTRPEFSYMIAPLWTDLYPVGQSRFRTQGDSTFQRYHWENIAEISNMSNLNTFGVEIRPSGFIGVNYANVNIQNQNTWIGTIGDPRLSEWNQIYYGRGIAAGTRTDWNLSETIGGVDECTVNPLSSTTCPGYTQAMCSTNPLYSTTCSGYAAAYYNQQCSINPLYHTGCSGYGQAYFNQQCSLDPLYNNQCPGYEDAYYIQQCTLDPLYDSGCTGYETAYFNQQCTNDALYNSECPGYREAYATKQLLETKSEEPVKSQLIEEVKVESIEQPQSQVATASPSDVTSPVQLVSTPPAAKTESTSTTSSQTTTAVASTSSSSSEKKDAPKTARQQIAERRLEAARQKAVEQGAKVAEQMDSAQTMEQQVQQQAVVLSAMGFVPGFDVYGKAFIPDGVAYKPFTIYNNQTNVDNARMIKGLTGASDKLHELLVDSQYGR